MEEDEKHVDDPYCADRVCSEPTQTTNEKTMNSIARCELAGRTMR